MRSLIAALTAAMLLAGCSTGASEETVTPNQDTPEAELQTWAGETCAAMSELKATVVGLTDSITIDLSAGLDQLPQVYADLETNILDLEERVDEVERVLGEAPASSPEAVAFATQAQELITSARSAGDAALAGARQAVDATNFLEAGAAAAGAVASAQRAYEDANAALLLIDQVTTGNEGGLSAAFAAAPECRSL